MKAVRLLTIISAALVIVAPSIGFAKNRDSAKEMEKNARAETKLGADGATEAQKTLKFITDEKYTKRVETIGQELATVAKLTSIPASYGNSYVANFAYSFKVVDDKEVNAFSLPAGYIYVNKGLLDRVESDDELAGVIAHEIAHAAHHHLFYLIEKKSVLDKGIYLLLAAAIASKMNAQDAGNILYGAQLLEVAKVNSYSIEAENDADNTAIQYMIKSKKYNPVGMLTFMEKLAVDQTYDPRIADLGIFNNHPESKKRVENITATLKKAGIAIDRRAVSCGLTASVKDEKVGEETYSDIMLGTTTLLKVAKTDSATSADRAKSIVLKLNKIFDTYPKEVDVKISPDGTGVYIKTDLVVDVLPEDAKLAGSTQEELAQKIKQTIQNGILSEQLKQMY